MTMLCPSCVTANNDAKRAWKHGFGRKWKAAVGAAAEVVGQRAFSQWPIELILLALECEEGAVG